VTSVQRMIDFAKLAFSSDMVKYLVITKVGGVAAQSGIPEVNKLALKSGKSFSVLPDLRDALDLFKPSTTYLVTSQASETLQPGLLEGRVYFVFSGIDSGFGKIELSMGKQVKMAQLNVEVGPVGAEALLLYCLLQGRLSPNV